MENFHDILIPLAASLFTAFVTACYAGRLTSREYRRQKAADLEGEYSSWFDPKKWGIYTQFIKLVRRQIRNETDYDNTAEETPYLDTMVAQMCNRLGNRCMQVEASTLLILS